MIWVTDATSATLYLCREWEAVTGQTAEAGLGGGWLEAVHPDDRGLIAAQLRRACGCKAEFWAVVRLLRPDLDPVWVVAGAAPCFSPLDRSFLGHLGTVGMAEPPCPPEAVGALGPFRPVPVPVQAEAAVPADRLDMIADHLLAAHALAAASQDESLADALLPGLYQAALRLGERRRRSLAVRH